MTLLVIIQRCPGPLLVEVVDGSGTPVDNGNFGRIVVTHLCEMHENGQARIHTGMQILRLAVGDGANVPRWFMRLRAHLRYVQRVGTTG